MIKKRNWLAYPISGELLNGFLRLSFERFVKKGFLELKTVLFLGFCHFFAPKKVTKKGSAL